MKTKFQFTCDQNAAAKKAFEKIRLQCATMKTDINYHSGILTFAIAKAFMKIVPSLKYRQAESWALTWLAINWI